MYQNALRDAGDASRAVREQVGDMNDRELLRPRLERALARCDAAAPSSPEWAAAMHEMDELSALAHRAILARRDGRRAVAAAPTAA
jgi:CHAD domain-containing protein